MSIFKKLLWPFLLCLTLGLAPYSPPHIIGKIKWIAGGANGMTATDYFDLILHGAPWIYLLFMIISIISNYLNTRKTAE